MHPSPSNPSLFHLNIADDREVAALAAALGCLPTDIFGAIAAVGDRLDAIRRYIQSTLGHERERRPCRLVWTADDLPPVWPRSEIGSRQLH